MNPQEGRARTRRMATAAVLSALGVVFLGVGALLEVLDLTMAAVASVCVVFAVIELRGGYPRFIWSPRFCRFCCCPSKPRRSFIFCLPGIIRCSRPFLKDILKSRFHGCSRSCHSMRGLRFRCLWRCVSSRWGKIRFFPIAICCCSSVRRFSCCTIWLSPVSSRPMCCAGATGFISHENKKGRGAPF